MTTHDTQRCSICGRCREDCAELIDTGRGIYVCDRCIKGLNAALEGNSEGTPEKAPAETFDEALPTPSELHEHLCNYVIGQERAKRILSVAVYNHYKRLKHLASGSDVELQSPIFCSSDRRGQGKRFSRKRLRAC